MDLEKTIRTNRQIMKLIKLKYEDAFPFGYRTTESKYYQLLEKETEAAQNYLGPLPKK